MCYFYITFLQITELKVGSEKAGSRDCEHMDLREISSVFVPSVPDAGDAQ